MSNRMPRKEACHDLVEFIHQRNVVCSMALLGALKAAHPELCPEEEPAADVEPEPVSEPAVLPPIPNALLAAAHEDEDPVLLPVVSIREIQRAVCREFGITLNELLSHTRTQNLMMPRHIAVYLCRKLTRMSLPVIADRFNGRDHTTAMNSVRKVERLLLRKPELAQRIQSIEGRFAVQ